jgi:hypothetical protein
MVGRQYAFTFTEKDLFRGYNVDVIRETVVKRKNKSRKELCSKIFADTFFEILLDIIKNNTTFVVPLRYGEYAEICIERIDGDKFKEMYRNGSFRDIDYIITNMGAYRMQYKYRLKNGTIVSKPIYLSKELNELLTKYINEGKEYY